MKIAIHAADLDHSRIDGTRVYILNLLRKFGKESPKDDFFIYHKTSFNKELTPPEFANYKVKALGRFFAWTHTRFAWELFKQKPEVLWVPLHNLPFLKSGKMKTIVTIHDLAFKFFPKYFTAKDLFKLNLLADHAIKKADKIIAISASTKKDILKLYPSIKEEKITVIHHGFDAELFQKEIKQNETEKILAQHNLKKDFYLLYVGAIQPRKNLNTLIEAFEKIKESYPEMKLVLAGEKAWMWEGVLQKIKKSPAKNDIVITGKLSFSELPVLYRNAAVFVFPSLYEGFGMPVLEAFASKVPVICANNSSLPEVGGEAALYFEKSDSQELSLKIKSLLENMNFRQEMIAKGEKRLKEFSWEKCVQETLNEIKS